MPRHFGRPSGGGYEGGCGYLLGLLVAMWVILWIFMHW